MTIESAEEQLKYVGNIKLKRALMLKTHLLTEMIEKFPLRTYIIMQLIMVKI